jgi:hypothetical protein
MDYGSAFVYMFSSEGWGKKLVLGVAMSLMPVLGPIVLMGWALDVLRNLNEGQSDPLPEWTGDDFARWLGRGIGLSVSVLTYLLPVIVVMMAIYMCGILAVAVAGGDSNGFPDALGYCFACLAFILYFLAGLGALVVFARYASTDRLDVGLDYAKTFQLVSTNIAPLLIIVILGFMMGFAGFILGILTLGIFFLIMPTYYSLVLAYFGAQLSQLPDFAE